jgi:hypothetical protein
MLPFRILAFALACGYAEALAGVQSTPTETENPGAICCASVEQMAMESPSFTYLACACQHPDGISVGEPPITHRLPEPRVGDLMEGIFGCEDDYTPMMTGDMRNREWCNFPQGICPFGYYESELITYDSCESNSGNKLVGFAKQSMAAGDPWNTFPTVLTMIKGLQEFEVRMDCSQDFDVLIGYPGFSSPDGKDCIVGRDCVFDRSATYNTIEACVNGNYQNPSVGVFCIDEMDFTNTNSPASSKWYWSGATEGVPVCMEKFAAKEIALRDYVIKIFPAASAYATLTYQFSGISPCPQFPRPSSCKRNPLVELTGDPHLQNLNGEIFDVSQEGDHILIQIPEGTGEQLEVIGKVEAFHKKRKCPVFFLTELKIRGSYVGTEPLQILSGESQFGLKQGSEFVHFDSEPVKIGYAAKVQKCDDSNIMCKTTKSGRRTPKFADKLLLTLPSSLSILTSHYASANPSFLNIGINGLHLQKKVGGLLGHGDHSHVIAEDEACRKKQKSKRRKVSMLQQASFISSVGHVE